MASWTQIITSALFLAACQTSAAWPGFPSSEAHEASEARNLGEEEHGEFATEADNEGKEQEPHDKVVNAQRETSDTLTWSENIGGEHDTEAAKEEGMEEGEETKEGAHESEAAKEEGMEEPTGVDLAIALMLLGTVVLVMSLFLIVNYPDEDIVYYGWSVISATISIFAAVLTFQAINFFMHHVLLAGRSDAVQDIGDVIQFFVHFALLQVTVAFMSGSCEAQPYKLNQTQFDVLDKKDIPYSVHEQLEFRDHLVKCWGTLQAHMTGFAAIAVGGTMQQSEWFKEPAYRSYFVVPIMFVGLTMFCRLVRQIRITLRNRVNAPLRIKMGKDSTEFVAPEEWLVCVTRDPEVFGVGYALSKWDEEVFECENDMCGLCVSFLLVQACRFNISGVLPNELGIEDKDHVPDPASVAKLMLVTGVFVIMTVALVFLHNLAFAKRVTPGTMKSFLKRSVTVARIVMSMSISWGLTYSAKWTITHVKALGNPNGIASRVVLSCLLSVIAFIMILILDKIADLECTGNDADTAIISIIYAIGILVGFAWEQSFDGGVEVIADLTPNPAAAELGMALVVSIVVIFPWRKYILPKVHKAAVVWSAKHEFSGMDDIALGASDATG